MIRTESTTKEALEWNTVSIANGHMKQSGEIPQDWELQYIRILYEHMDCNNEMCYCENSPAIIYWLDLK